MKLRLKLYQVICQNTQISANKSLKSESISEDMSSLSLNTEPIMNIQYEKENTIISKDLTIQLSQSVEPTQTSMEEIVLLNNIRTDNNWAKSWGWSENQGVQF